MVCMPQKHTKNQCLLITIFVNLCYFGYAWSLFLHGFSLVVARGATLQLQSTGSVVVVHGLSCSMACEIFPDQGSYLCLLHWQADSPLLSPRGSLLLLFKAILKLENKNCIFNKIHCLEPTTNIILDSDMLEDFLFGNTQASLLSLLALFQKF